MTERILLHGTHGGVIEKIIKEGLKPQENDILRNIPNPLNERKDAVYVTSDITTAAQYGFMAWIRQCERIIAQGTDPRSVNLSIAIIEMRIQEQRLIKDHREVFGESYYIMGGVPPEWIHSYDIYCPFGNKTKSSAVEEAISSFTKGTDIAAASDLLYKSARLLKASK
jgi:hypothetical protein